MLVLSFGLEMVFGFVRGRFGPRCLSIDGRFMVDIDERTVVCGSLLVNKILFGSSCFFLFY